ncbi:hypothetical protein DFQ28_007068 [Apophysomyces sp. BC1034]|nr:hypothetical protein DFQ30_006965 [Apophysomyces sp. BC1015]KAG0175401.1 hypothetical protein DFQ29_007155 [Apophysomyces sp. BC1021]KAG0186962.1 hypothetical protein DFQ28_007068 [Apophysomyces sp. BC1034]
MANNTHERKLGVLEKYQVSKQLTKAYGTVNLMAELQHDPRSDNTEQFYLDKFYAALKKLVDDHPQLCLAVVEEDQSSAHFIHLTSFDLTQVVHFVEERYWETRADLLAEECRVEIDLKNTDLPVWRLRISSHPERPDECGVTLAMHHVGGDGMTLSIFWQELLRHINAEPSVPRTTYMIERPAKPVPPPYEARNPPTANFLDVIPLLCKQAMKKLPLVGDLFQNKGWAGDFPAVADEAHHTVVRLAQVGGATWETLSRKAKQQQVSVHAVVYTALLLGWSDVYPDESVVELSTLINCRSLCQPPVPKNELGNFVGAYARSWERPFPDFWVLTRTYHKALQRNKAVAAKQSTMLKFLQDYPKSYKEMWYQKRRENSLGRTGGMELSDLGRFVVDQDTWRLKSIWFCQSAHTFSTVIGANTITANGNMYATISWQKGSVDENKAEMVADKFVERLHEAAKTVN